MLDTLSSSEPVLLLAVVDESHPFFVTYTRPGVKKDNRVLFTQPDKEKRRKFFDELLDDIRRPPTLFFCMAQKARFGRVAYRSFA
ncbi:hypothetical protein DFH11DRAFT_1633972 [Phellopilus nigrolimitatus]|nr:hypothetical protein DFH11DRAFT_1633972 [Phellopilus nigrolimitatus]